MFQFQAAAQIGVDYAGLQRNAKLQVSCKDLQNCAYWGKRLNSLKVLTCSIHLDIFLLDFFERYFKLG